MMAINRITEDSIYYRFDDAEVDFCSHEIFLHWVKQFNNPFKFNIT